MDIKIFLVVLLAAATFGDDPPPATGGCADVTDPTDWYYACDATCKILLCNADKTQAKEADCPGTTPYCTKNADNTGYCSTIQGKCTAKTNTFTCTSAGSFPDPSNCRTYHVCSKKLEVISRKCKDNEVFSEVTGLCKVSTNPAECIVVDCKATMGNGIFSQYGTSKKYYALCYKETPTALIDSIKMFQCAKGAEFDRTVAVSKCVYKCTAEGKFEYSLDETKYFNCAKGSDGKITATVEKCALGIFKPAEKDCGFARRGRFGIL